MNARVAELVAGGTDRMPLAGDQLYLDLDLSLDNLPAGSLLAVGEAVWYLAPSGSMTWPRNLPPRPATGTPPVILRQFRRWSSRL